MSLNVEVRAVRCLIIRDIDLTQWFRSPSRTHEPLRLFPDNREVSPHLLREDSLWAADKDRFEMIRSNGIGIGSAQSPKRRCFLVKNMVNTQKNAPPEPQPSLQLSTKDFRLSPSSGTVTSLLLRPCHICHRRPTTRAVLSGYIDCEDCGKRTCFICVRECGDDGCRYAERMESVTAVDGLKRPARPYSRRKRICTSCSVENIDTEGQDTVTCLECHFMSRS